MSTLQRLVPCLPCYANDSWHGDIIAGIAEGVAAMALAAAADLGRQAVTHLAGTLLHAQTPGTPVAPVPALAAPLQSAGGHAPRFAGLHGVSATRMQVSGLRRCMLGLVHLQVIRLMAHGSMHTSVMEQIVSCCHGQTLGIGSPAI